MREEITVTTLGSLVAALPSKEDGGVVPDPAGPGQFPRRGGTTWAPGPCPHDLLWFSGASLPTQP